MQGRHIEQEANPASTINSRKGGLRMIFRMSLRLSTVPLAMPDWALLHALLLACLDECECGIETKAKPLGRGEQHAGQLNVVT